MMKRSRQSLLFALLLAFGLVMPGIVVAQGARCCDRDADQESAVASGTPNCCFAATPCDPEPVEESGTPADEGGCGDDCDCPGSCCLAGKAPVGVTSLGQIALPAAPGSAVGIVSDRSLATATELDIAHPPRH